MLIGTVIAAIVFFQRRKRSKANNANNDDGAQQMHLTPVYQQSGDMRSSNSVYQTSASLTASTTLGQYDVPDMSQEATVGNYVSATGPSSSVYQGLSNSDAEMYGDLRLKADTDADTFIDRPAAPLPPH